MQLNSRDKNLVPVLSKLTQDEKTEMAKALKRKSFDHLKEEFYSPSDPNQHPEKDINDTSKDDYYLEMAIRYYGSDWLWHGVFKEDWATYDELLRGIAKFQKIKYTDNTSIEDIEHRIMVSIINKAWDKMKEEERQKYEEEIVAFENEMSKEAPERLKELLDKLKVKTLRGLTPGALLTAGLAFKMGGFTSYRILAIVMGSITRALVPKAMRMAVQRLFMRGASLTIPILNIFMTVWLVWDVRKWICGPSMSKVIPAVFLVGAARIKQRGEEE